MHLTRKEINFYLKFKRSCHHETCGEGATKIIYTWALDAQGIKFEPGVGFKVSGDTNLNYFVIESHYNFNLPLGYSDSQTAYVLKMTRQQLVIIYICIIML